MNIVTVGAIYVDIKGYPHTTFVPTGRNAGDIKYFHGGVARNVAEDVAVLGENSIFVSLTDGTGVGADVVRHLEAVKVNTDYIRLSANGMGTWMAVFNTDGNLFASISKRPQLDALSQILEEQGDKLFQNTDSVLLEMDIEEEIVAKVMALAEKYSVPVYGVISNMTIGMERLAYIKRTACFICNRLEAGIFFGKDVSALKPEAMLTALKEDLAAKGMQAMVVTMDAEGSVFANAKGENGVCEAIPLEVVDNTGAGDAFFAGTSVGLTRGLSFAEACSLGTKAAAGVLVTKENVLSSL